MNKNKEIVITNSKWATFTVTIFTSLIWLWSLGHLPEFLIGILFSFSVWIAYFDYKARHDILVKAKRFSVIQILLLLGDILIKCVYHNDVLSLVISVVVTSFIVWFIFYGIFLLIQFLDNALKNIISRSQFKSLIRCLSKLLIKGLSPGAVMFIATLCIGIISVYLPNATWKVVGVLISTFFSSYKKSIKKSYENNIYDKYIIDNTRRL